MIPWGEAIEVGGVGFGMVFALLIVLALVILLVGKILNRNGGGDNKATGGEKGE